MLSTTVFSQSYPCDGVTTAFTFTFPIYADYGVEVTVAIGSLTDTLDPISDYTMMPANTFPYDYSNGGIVAVNLLASVPNGAIVTIARKTPLTQLSNYINNQYFDQVSLTRDLDKIYMVLQEIAAVQSTQAAFAPYFYNLTMTADDIIPNESTVTVATVDTNGADRNITPVAGFTAGSIILLANKGVDALVFDPADLDHALGSGEKAWFVFDGTNWR
jgi:hypothetical protein